MGCWPCYSARRGTQQVARWLDVRRMPWVVEGVLQGARTACVVHRQATTVKAGGARLNRAGTNTAKTPRRPRKDRAKTAKTARRPQRPREYYTSYSMVCTYALWYVLHCSTSTSMSVNAAPCVSVILTMREMSVILTQIDLLSVKLTHSPHCNRKKSSHAFPRSASLDCDGRWERSHILVPHSCIERPEVDRNHRITFAPL